MTDMFDRIGGVLALRHAETARRAGMIFLAILAAAMFLVVMPVGGSLAQTPSPNPAAAADTAGDGGPAGSEPTRADLEALKETLTDESRRERLVQELNALIELRQTAAAAVKPPVPERPLSARLSDAVAEKVAVVATRVSRMIGTISRAPELAGWFQDWIGQPGKSERLFGILWRFIAMIAAGLAVEHVYRRLLRSYRLSLERAPQLGLLVLGWRFAMHALVLLGRPVAFAAGAFGLLSLVSMTGAADRVLALGAAAFVAARVIMAVVRALLAPNALAIRLLPVGDETASYLNIWTRRMVVLFIYTLFLIEAMRIAGLPQNSYTALLLVVGFLFAVFLATFVLQNRHLVAAGIRGSASPTSLRTRLAGSWHLLAILYVAVAYGIWLLQTDGGFFFLVRATLWTIAVFVVARMVVALGHRGLAQLFRVSPAREALYPGLEARANRYLPIMKSFLAWVVYIIAFLVAIDVWGLDILAWLASPSGVAVVQKIVTIAAIFLVALLVWEGISLLIARYLARLEVRGGSSARALTLLPLMKTAVLILIATMTLLIVVGELGVNIAPLLAGAGVIGLAIGFGSQKLVQDVITGLFMLIENTLAVGDVVRFDADHVGVVEEITIRSVRLRDLNGAVHTLPFSEVRTTLNMTKDFSYYMMNVGVAYRENVDHVMDVLRDLGGQFQADPDFGPDILEPIEVMGLQEFGDSAIVVRARLKTKPGRQWAVGREFNRRMKARFDAEGIEIPFPHRTIYFGEDREGRAPAAHVRLNDTADAASADQPDAAGRKNPDEAT